MSVPRLWASVIVAGGFPLLLGTACGESTTPEPSDSGLTPASLTDHFGIQSDRARVLASVVDNFILEIGGPDAYRDVMLKVDAQPSPQSLAAATSYLALRGSVRLGKSGVDSLAFIRSKLFEEFGDEGCAVLVESVKEPATGWRAMAKLDSATLADAFGFYAKATVAVLRETGSVPEFDRDRLVSAWRTFAQMLSPTERKRFIRFVDSSAQSTEEECWFQRRLWRLLPQLPELDAQIILWQLATNKIR